MKQLEAFNPTFADWVTKKLYGRRVSPSQREFQFNQEQLVERKRLGLNSAALLSIMTPITSEDIANYICPETRLIAFLGLNRLPEQVLLGIGLSHHALYFPTLTNLGYKKLAYKHPLRGNLLLNRELIIKEVFLGMIPVDRNRHNMERLAMEALSYCPYSSLSSQMPIKMSDDTVKVLGSPRYFLNIPQQYEFNSREYSETVERNVKDGHKVIGHTTTVRPGINNRLRRYTLIECIDQDYPQDLQEHPIALTQNHEELELHMRRGKI